MYVIKENSHIPLRNIWYNLHVLLQSKVGSKDILDNLTSILQSFHIQNEYLMKISIIINK